MGLRRHENQDTFALEAHEKLLVAVVCDGMGGVEGGKIASAVAVETFMRDIRALLRGDMTAEQLRLARETFSRTLWQVGLALAAMTFMVMRSVRLMNVLPQELMTAAAIVLQILSTKLVEPAVQRSLHEKYGDILPNGKEDDQ